MITRGFDKPLYVLPFDHRGSFETGMFAWKGALTPEQTAQIATTKQVIYDGFKTALAAGVHKENAGILADERRGWQKGRRMADDGGRSAGIHRLRCGSAFWEPLVNWRAKKIPREAAVAEIARRYREFVDIFENARVERSTV